MRKYAPFLLIGLLFLFFLSAVKAQNNIMIGQITLENINEPSFENQGNWIFNGSAGLFTTPSAPTGNKVLFLRGQSSASQDITIATDGCFRFDIQAALAQYPRFNGFKILINGMEVLEAEPDSTDFNGYYSVAFTLVAGTHNIQIAGTQNTSFAILLDDINLSRLPCWSDPGVWTQSSVPDLADTVHIRDNGVVVLDEDGLCHSIRSKGQLLAANNEDLNFEADLIMIMEQNGLLEWGQANTPYEESGVVTLKGNIGIAQQGDQTAALMVMGGGQLQLHGQERDAWTQLGLSAYQGDSQVTLKEEMDWKVGDEIVIASTDFDPHQAETRIISQVSGGGTVFHFNDTLAYNHFGEIQYFPLSQSVSELDERAEVGLLSRNLKIQGDADANVDKAGGHIMIEAGSFAQVSGVELFQMGQEGILGRYPFHWHLTGDLSGQYLKNSSINVSFNRVMTVHTSTNGLIENNVAYDHIGNGYFLENGDETGNRFIGNLGILTRAAALGKEVREYDRFPAGSPGTTEFTLPATFWITHPTNDFIGNVSGGSEGSGFWMVVQDTPIEGTNPGGITPVTAPLGVFDNNVSHSTAFSNFAIDLKVIIVMDSIHKLVDSGTYKPPSTPFINNFISYKSRDRSIWMRTESLDFDSCALADNSKGTFFSYHNVIRNSLYVGKSDNIGTPSEWIEADSLAGRSLPSPARGFNATQNHFKAHPLYDGPSGVENCHFANYYGQNASVFHPNTAATKSTVHFSTQLTFDSVPLPNKFSNLTSPDRDFQWTTGIIDLDGSIDPLTNPLDVIKPKIFPSENPDRRLYDEGFNVEVGAQYIPEWGHYICPNEHYGLLLMFYDWESSRKVPMYSIRSDGFATITEGQSGQNQIPVIVNNDNYRYYLQHHKVADELEIRLKFLSQFDVATFVLMNVPSSSIISKINGAAMLEFIDIDAFENSNEEGYYFDNNTLYVRLKGLSQHHTPQFGDEFPYTSNIKICQNAGCVQTNPAGTYEMPLADYENGLDERAVLSTSGNLTLENIMADQVLGNNSFVITSDGDGLDEYVEYRLNFHRQAWSEFNNLDFNYSGPEIEVLLNDQSEGEIPLGFYKETSCYGIDLTRLPKEEVDQIDAVILRVRESALGSLNQAGLRDTIFLDKIILDYARDLWDFHRNEEDWFPTNATFTVNDGIMDFNQTAGNGYISNDLFFGKPAVNPEDNPDVVLRMKTGTTVPDSSRFYYFPWGSGWTFKNFKPISDDQFHNYIISPNWNGNFDISRVRVDPLRGAGAGDCEIDFVRFTSCSDCYNEVLDVQNGETGIDCGGPFCVPCPCEDGVQNNGETGIDCGGPNCQPCSQLVFENGILTNVSDNWITVNTVNTYSDMVVIATPVLTGISEEPVVTRIQKTDTTSFEIKLQNPSSSTVANHQVHYFVVEAGIYSEAMDGINLEAWTEMSTATAGKSGWVMENRSLDSTYSNLVLLGQVQSYNDPLWSVFWASESGQRKNPPSGLNHIFAGGKHVGEDSPAVRVDEAIGFIAIEAGLYELDGQVLQAGLGQDQIFGVQNAQSTPPLPYVLSSQIDIQGAVLSSAAMDGIDGGWPVLYSNTPIKDNQIYIAIDEDKTGDIERTHVSEQVAYLAFGDHAGESFTEPEQELIFRQANPDNSNAVLVFPNPLVEGQNFIVKSLNENTLEPANLEIFSVDGKSVPLNWQKLSSDRLEIVVDLSPGLYFVIYEEEGVRSFSKMVVIASEIGN